MNPATAARQVSCSLCSLSSFPSPGAMSLRSGAAATWHLARPQVGARVARAGAGASRGFSSAGRRCDAASSSSASAQPNAPHLPPVRSQAAPMPAASASSEPGPSALNRPAASATASPSPSDSATSDPADDATTHFGFRTIPSSSKETLVGSVFSSVAASYDVMNDAMSLGIHRLWKDHFVSTVLDPRGGIRVLDVAGGTGDIALRILDHARERYGDRSLSVRVLDINADMLREGVKRSRKTMYWDTDQIRFTLGNAESLHTPMPIPGAPASPETATATISKGPRAGAARLPPLTSSAIPDNSLDLYTIAFGIRNCTHIDQVLAEAHRVLKPGGVFACLEFGKVGVPLLAELYRTYSFTFIPSMGQILAGDRDSYQYLIESIERFPSQPDFARMIRAAGFALPGTAEAESLGWRPFEHGSGTFGRAGNALGSVADLGLGLVGRLPIPGLSGLINRQREMMEEQQRRATDVQGAWEDLTFGIASIWTGIKPRA